MADIATSDAFAHDYELTRHNWRTDKPYSVWVKVTHYTPAERQTHDDPGYDAEIGARGWGSLGQEIELDDDDLSKLLELVADDSF